jgi:hypothetical protein
MRTLSLLVMCTLAGGATVAGQESSIRPVDRLALAAYDSGQRRSDHFRDLVAELDKSDVIVHVVTTHELPPGVMGATRFVALIEGSRYVRVHLAQSLTPKLRVAMLAHELQHACELARSDVTTPSAVRDLYLSIGRAATSIENEFETADAEQSGRTVWEELGGGGLRAHGAER